MLQQFLVNGVPLNFDLKEDVDPRTLYMYVDEEYIKQLIPLIKMAGSVVPEDAKIEIPATSGSPPVHFFKRITDKSTCSVRENGNVGDWIEFY